jgi:hypothetical protein
VKLAPRNYLTHLDILFKRMQAKAARDRAGAANAREPSRRTPPMSLERRMAGYMVAGPHGDLHRQPTSKQLRRMMRKSGTLDPAVILAAWQQEIDGGDTVAFVRLPRSLERSIRAMRGPAADHVIFDESARLTGD